MPWAVSQEVVRTLIRFDRWLVDQKRACGVACVEVELERRQHVDVPATTIKLTCPKCHDTITSVVRDVDMPQVMKLLNPRTQT